jgi:hypothetical protein
VSTPPQKSQVAGAADVLRQVLAKVDAGELEAPGRRGAAVVKRLRGALLGLDVASGRDP